VPGLRNQHIVSSAARICLRQAWTTHPSSKLQRLSKFQIAIQIGDRKYLLALGRCAKKSFTSRLVETSLQKLK
jgi:hypothetical protein